jgi:IclR family transcriptional regulator, acetate operon repressor
MAGNSNERHRTVTSKTAAILLALTVGQGHTLSTIARETALPVSTVHRLLRDLAASPLVERVNDAEYRLGSPLRDLTSTTVLPTLVTHAPHTVDDLVGVLKMTVRLGVVDALQVAYIGKGAESRPGTSFPNRARLPLHATAMGKTLLAYGPTTLLHATAAVGLSRFTSRTITDAGQLRQETLRTRLRGYSISDRELHLDIRTVGVPVLDTSGGTIAAIEVHVPDLSEPTIAHVTPALAVAAYALARQLNHYTSGHVQVHSIRRATGNRPR